MYKEKTFENILSDMLDAAPEGIDTRCGSLYYDAVAPAAAELAKLYVAIAEIMKEAFPDTASEEYLLRHGAKYGLIRTPATAAVLSGHFDVPISEGTRFALGDHNYVSGELIKYQNGYYYYKMYCEDAGAAQNSTASGIFIPLSYIDGLTVAAADSLIIAGEDEEELEVYRKRVCAAGTAVPYGGNVSDYTSCIMGIEGVGGVKIYPAWEGGGTVRALIQAADGGVPSSDLIAEIKSLLDPDAYSGDGAGIAPIGHSVTVEGVVAYEVSIKTSLTYGEGWDSTTAAPYIASAVKEYVDGLAAAWQKSDSTTLRIAQIESAIIGTGCVVDISGTMIYSLFDEDYLAENIILGEGFVPVFSEVTAE